MANWHSTAIRCCQPRISPANVVVPGELQVHLTTRHRNWEARVAAGGCFRLLAEHMQHFTPGDLLAQAGLSPSKLPTAGGDSGQHTAGFVLEKFRLDQVLQNGKVLLQSGGEVGLLRKFLSKSDSVELYCPLSWCLEKTEMIDYLPGV
jgi:hypothetical protein